MKKKLKIFISSTIKDLANEREIVARAINDLHFEAIRAETLGSRPETPAEICKTMVQESDIFIGIYGNRYGYVPENEVRSITEIEFDEARRMGKDILIYIKGNHWPEVEPEQKQKEFLNQTEDFVAGYFRRPHFQNVIQLEEWIKEDIASLVSSRFVTKKYVQKEDTILRQYCEYIIQFYKQISFSGLVQTSSGLNFPIDEIFISPLFKESNTSNDYVLDIDEIINKNRQIVILGSPGIGKTILLKFLAYEAAKKNLQSKESTTPLPILVPLASYVSQLETEDKMISLLEHISKFTAERSQTEFLPTIHEAIESQNALILLDGLDEIYNQAKRENIKNQIETLCIKYPKLQIVLTSRVSGFDEIKGFSVFEILPWDQNQIDQFIKQWFITFNDQLSLGANSEKQTFELVNTIRQSNILSEISKNPLFLVITISLFLQAYRLPTRRAELYSALTGTLLMTWERARSLSHTLGRASSISVGEDILKEVALNMMSNGVSVISKVDLIGTIHKVLSTRFSVMDITKNDCIDILTALTEKAVLLREIGVGHFSFIHLIFQEFFAAQAVANMPNDKAYNYIIKHFYSPKHEEMIRLAFEEIFITQQRQEFGNHLIEGLLPAEQYIDFNSLSSLCLLLVDDININENIRDKILESLFHHWVLSTDSISLELLENRIRNLSNTSFEDDVVKRLLHIIHFSKDDLRERTIPLLSYFHNEIGTKMSEFTELVNKEKGTIRWIAAAELSKLGMEDNWILSCITGESIQEAEELYLLPNSQESLRSFSIEKFQHLYSETINANTNSEKVRALEDLTEYLFSCIPGLTLTARNLRTLTEEIDLAFMNNGLGFWRRVDDPFIIECKNLKTPIDAKTIRDLSGKLRIKSIKSAFLITTNHLTKDARIEIRQALSDGKFIISVEDRDFEKIKNGEELEKVLSDCFYKCRLS